jgi:hypothetical protein
MKVDGHIAGMGDNKWIQNFNAGIFWKTQRERKIGQAYTRIDLRELGSEDGRRIILPQDHIL